MNKRLRDFFPATLAALMPSEFVAYESGVNAMDTAETHEANILAQWAYNELVSLETGHRAMLEPLIPMPKQEYSELDMQIADVIAQGYIENRRIQKIIDEFIEPPDNVVELTLDQPTNSLFFSLPQEGEIGMLHDLTIDTGIVPDYNMVGAIDVVDVAPIVTPIQSIAQQIHNLIGYEGNDN